jgi:beta-lactamase superfamily II metal-dependent hydrolase
MLTVFNVGQGDSFLLEAHKRCKFNTPPLLIDAGYAYAKVASRVQQGELYVMITHADKDHIGGLPRILKTKCIQRLYIPYFLPEIVRINEFLRKHIKNKIASPDWNLINKSYLKLVAQDDTLCSHIRILNPPRNPGDFHFDEFNGEGDINEALGILASLGIELPRVEIVNYNTPISQNVQIEPVEGYNFMARKLVHDFFISLSNVLRTRDRSARGYYINKHVAMTANQASIVFKYESPDGNWLFTGDADETVFERLINQGKDISSKYLKVPHHGSRENLSKRTLNAINPEYAIISHDNRVFGKSRDAHPHYEIMDMLDNHRVTTYYTNDVIKSNRIFKTKSSGQVLNGLITFK